MGAGTDADIEAFQEATGIKPARGEYADKLDELCKEAFSLIQIITLESSGIRDGSGHWHYSDPLAGTIDNINRLMERIEEIRRAPTEADQGGMQHARTDKGANVFYRRGGFTEKLVKEGVFGKVEKPTGEPTAAVLVDGTDHHEGLRSVARRVVRARQELVQSYELNVPAEAEAPERLQAAYQAWNAWFTALRPALSEVELAKVLKALEVYTKQNKAYAMTLAACEAGAHPETGEMPEFEFSDPSTSAVNDPDGLGKRNKLEHYATRPLTHFRQFDGFLGCHPDDDVMRPDDDGHALIGVTTEELMHGAHVRVLVKPETPAKDASAMLRKIADWIDRDGMDALGFDDGLSSADDELCPRCGAHEQATHHELCQARDGTPMPGRDEDIRRKIAERLGHDPFTGEMLDGEAA